MGYPDGSSLSYLYDKAGLVKQVTNGRGQSITLGYDTDERLHEVDAPGMSPISYAYNADGTVKSFTDGAGATSYAYLTNGWVKSVTYDYSNSGLSLPQELDYLYFPDGSRQSMTWKNGTTTVGTWTYGYDAGGRLTSLSNPFGENTTWAYDGEDKLTSQTNANGTSTDYGYNNQTGWVTSIAQKKGATPFASYALTYDHGANTVGLLTGVSQGDGGSSSYWYDGLSQDDGSVPYNGLYRLTGETETPSGGSPTSHSYSYDLAGNITAFDANSYGFDAANKISNSGFTYDGDGNSTDVNLIGTPYAWQGYSPTWDALGRMIATSKPGAYSFAYDARGLRVEMQGGASVDPTFYIYDGGTLLGEAVQDPYLPTPSVSAVYTWGANGLLSANFGGRSLRYHCGEVECAVAGVFVLRIVTRRIEIAPTVVHKPITARRRLLRALGRFKICLHHRSLSPLSFCEKIFLFLLDTMMIL